MSIARASRLRKLHRFAGLSCLRPARDRYIKLRSFLPGRIPRQRRPEEFNEASRFLIDGPQLVLPEDFRSVLPVRQGSSLVGLAPSIPPGLLLPAMRDLAVPELPELVRDLELVQDLERRGRADSADNVRDRVEAHPPGKRRVHNAHPRKDAEDASSIQRPRKAR